MATSSWRRRHRSGDVTGTLGIATISQQTHIHTQHTTHTHTHIHTHTQSHRRSGRPSERRQHCQGNGDVIVRETATSSSGKRRRHRQGNGDVITVTSGIATISQQSDAFATMLEDRPKQHASAWGLSTKFVTMAALTVFPTL